MTSLERTVALATSGPIAFLTVLFICILTGMVIYFTYRAFRDLEVFLLERQRLREELIDREEDKIQWDSSSE